jgi:thiamine-phosphate pyrophosphorylase
LLLYYITDRSQFPGNTEARRARLLEKIAEAAQVGVDYIQLREKDLPIRELEALARQAFGVIRDGIAPTALAPTRLLINSRTDVALAVGAEGVHLRADDISPSNVQQIWKGAAGAKAHAIVSISCHSLEEVARADDGEDTDLALLAPVFAKHGSPGSTPTGLGTLRQACRHKIPVLALGGVTLENARRCVEAGAAGIAAIRLFQENTIAEVVRTLRG